MSEDQPTYQPIGESELVLGLVYGAGAEIEPVEQLLRERLEAYAYRLRTVHLSDYFPAVLGRIQFNRETPNATRELQDMGDDLREKTGKDAAQAQLAVFLIAARRAGLTAPAERTAWLVRSLRRPEEVTELRRLYGPRFILIGVHVPEVVRQQAAEERRQRWSTVTAAAFDVEATADLRRDEDDPKPHGQRMRDTFSQADFFVDARSSARLAETLPRAVRLIFGEPFVPPLRDEQAMYHAFTVGLRSTEMGRQVGAALMTSDGDVIAVGTNEVPTGGGGLYWSPDQPDERDFAQQPPIDSNTEWQRRIARELLVRMARGGWLPTEHVTEVDEDTFDVTDDQLDVFLRQVRGTRFNSITEFGRAVHAEMDALTTAARLGISVRGSTAVTTTWPCHNCTRHLIAAGIARVLYLYPYRKSLARELHRDALLIEPREPGPVPRKVVFEQFLGVSPRVYPQYFDFGQASRRDFRGRAMEATSPRQATPRVLESAGTFTFGGPVVPASHVAELERQLAVEFRTALEATEGLTVPAPSLEEET